MQETLEHSETEQTQEKPPTWIELYHRTRRLVNLKLWAYRKTASPSEFTGAVLDSLTDLREVFDAESVLEGGLTTNEDESEYVEEEPITGIDLIDKIRTTDTYNKPSKDYELEETYDWCINGRQTYSTSIEQNKIYNDY